MSPDNSMVCTEAVKLPRHILFSFVILQLPNLQTVLHQSIGPVLLDSKEGLTLGSERNGSLEPRPVINKGDPILVARVDLDRKRAMKVRMDKAKQPRGESVDSGEGISMHLARETGLTDGIRRGWRIEFNACSKALGDKRLYSLVVVVC